MSLIGRLIDKLLTKGSITLLAPGKGPRTYGRGAGRHLTVRFTDRKVAFDILKSPSLGVGEAYMDGRLITVDPDDHAAHRLAKVAGPVNVPLHGGDPRWNVGAAKPPRRLSARRALAAPATMPSG